MSGLAGVAYSNYTMRNSSSSIVNDKGERTGFDLGRLLRSGIYIPISEALLMFYQVSNSVLAQQIIIVQYIYQEYCCIVRLRLTVWLLL